MWCRVVWFELLCDVFEVCVVVVLCVVCGGGDVLRVVMCGRVG